MADTPSPQPRVGNAEDLSGRQFGSWKVIRRIEPARKIKSRTRWWLVECKCGKQVPTTTNYLLRGRANNCGCDNSHKRRCGEKNYAWRGHHEIAGKYWNSLFNGAIRRGLDFTISAEYAWQLFLQQGRRCAISGRELSFKTYKTKRGWSGNASLDRIDSSKGYIEGNVQWVHRVVNTMKWTMTNSELVDWCREIINWHESDRPSSS